MKSNRGITFIELLVVIVIVGVLAAIAIPTYTNYMMRARRADAKTALEQLRASQEMFRAERGSYSTDLTQLVNSWGVSATAGDYGLIFYCCNSPIHLLLRPSQPRHDRHPMEAYLSTRMDENGIRTERSILTGKWAK